MFIYFLLGDAIDATHLKQFDLKEQKQDNVDYSHIRSKKEKKEIFDHNFNPFVFNCKLSTCDKLLVSEQQQHKPNSSILFFYFFFFVNNICVLISF